MTSVIGVDLGGTKIHAARFDTASWEIQAEERVPTHAARKFDHVMDDMVALVGRLRKEGTVAVGVGVPGLVTHEGTVLRLPNIPGSEHVPLQKVFDKRTKLPTVVENDANCFAYAEALHGSGKGHRVVLGITMGTGVGGGIVIDGTIYHGHHGFAGEIGHMLLCPGEPPFEAENKRGEVEQFISGTAMGKRCEAAKRPEEYLEGQVCSFLQPQVFREVAWMCVNLVHLLDPSVIIFGGSAGGALGPHLKDIEKELKQWIFPGTPLPPLAIATFRRAATRGAAILASKLVV